MRRLALVILSLMALSACDTGTEERPPPEPTPAPIPTLRLVASGPELLRESFRDSVTTAGEEIEFYVYVRNDSTVATTPLDVRLQPSPMFEGVQLLQQAGSFSDGQTLAPGATARLRVKLSIVRGTAPGTYPLVLTFSASNGATKNVEVRITTKPVRHSVAFSGARLIADTDADGRAEPGELLTYELTFANTGTGATQRLCPFLSTPSAYVTEITDDSYRTSGRSGVCFYLDQLEIALGRTGFTRPKLRLSSLLSAGEVVPVQYRLTDDLGNTWDFEFSITVQ